MRRSWTGGGLSDVHVEETLSPAGLIYHCTKLSAPPGQGSPLSQPAPHSLARLLTHRPANLISVHRCFSIRSTQQASIIQLRHRKAKVSLSGVTYKAAFFPHIRLGFGSTTTTAMAHVSTRLYQPLYTHKPFTWTTYLSNPQAILVLRLDERPFKRENKTLLICRLLRAESTEEARRPMECRPGSDRPITAAVSYSSVVGPVGQTQNTLRHVTIRRANYYSNVCEGMLGVV